jgi:hypothetical protein
VAGIFAFRCSACSKIHEGSPSYGFRAPDPFLEQPPQIQSAGRLSDDFCEYEDEDGRHYFVRGCIEVPIHGVSDPFLWGVWTSLSEQNYRRYADTYDSSDVTDRYLGWLCNYLPYYPKTYALKTHVHPRIGGVRPYVVPESTDHPLSIDFHEGISVARAQEIAESLLHVR